MAHLRMDEKTAVGKLGVSREGRGGHPCHRTNTGSAPQQVRGWGGGETSSQAQWGMDTGPQLHPHQAQFLTPQPHGILGLHVTWGPHKGEFEASTSLLARGSVFRRLGLAGAESAEGTVRVPGAALSTVQPLATLGYYYSFRNLNSSKFKSHILSPSGHTSAAQKPRMATILESAESTTGQCFFGVSSMEISPNAVKGHPWLPTALGTKSKTLTKTHKVRMRESLLKASTLHNPGGTIHTAVYKTGTPKSSAAHNLLSGTQRSCLPTSPGFFC